MRNYVKIWVQTNVTNIGAHTLWQADTGLSTSLRPKAFICHREKTIVYTKAFTSYGAKEFTVRRTKTLTGNKTNRSVVTEQRLSLDRKQRRSLVP